MLQFVVFSGMECHGGHTTDEQRFKRVVSVSKFVRSLVCRDREAVSTLARECAGPICDYLRKTKRQHGRKESEFPDILQEVLIRFIFEPPKLDPARPLLPYLKKMALNKARDIAKKETRRKQREKMFVEWTVRMAAGGEIASQNIEIQEDLDLLDSVLSTMSITDQNALTAYKEAGPNRHVRLLSIRENISIGAAQMRFKRAFDRLRVALKRTGRFGRMS